MREQHPLEAVLLAGPPTGMDAEELALFGQFTGSWDLEVCWYDAGSLARRSRGEWHFGWILEGRAIQDVWIVPPLDEGGQAGAYEYGTSIRFYDAAAGLWHSTWHGPVQASLRQFTARATHDGIILEGEQIDGREIRWRFLEITSETFSWRFEQRTADGSAWRLLQSFECRRRPGAPGETSSVGPRPGAASRESASQGHPRGGFRDPGSP
jgi:hypothetical protein